MNYFPDTSLVRYKRIMLHCDLDYFDMRNLVIYDREEFRAYSPSTHRLRCLCNSKQSFMISVNPYYYVW